MAKGDPLIKGRQTEGFPFRGQCLKRDLRRLACIICQASALSGIEFVKRHLRHVQPAKLRAVRYYGYHHPAAKKNRQRVQQGSGAAPMITAPRAPSEEAAQNQEAGTAKRKHLCPCCQQPMQMIARIMPSWTSGALWVPVQSRAPPSEKGAQRA
jgi:hypothetical protein